MIRFIKFCFLGFILMQTTACVDQEFDTPPGKAVQVEDISTTTIAALKELHTIGAELATPVPAGTIIKGIVISDDNAGSFFKEMVIQDESGGILIRINRADLSTIYRPGKQVFVRCDGLNIGDFNGLIQMGIPASGPDIERIPDTDVDMHIVEGEFIAEITPNQISLSDINSSLYSTLVEVQGVQFEEALLGSTLAVPNGGGTQNRTIEDCDERELTLRASDFADFAGAPIPNGNGTITGVLSIFGTTKQIGIRDVDDIIMEGARCDGSGGVQVEDISTITIAELKQLHTIGGNATPLPTGTIIKGTVISDDSSGSFFKELVIQDATGGILVRINKFDLSDDLRQGKQVFINCTGLNIGDYNGLNQIGYPATGSDIDRIPEEAYSTHIIEGEFVGEIVPNQISLADFNSSLYNTLVEIQDVEFEDGLLGSTIAVPDGGGTQNRTVEDCFGDQVTLRASDFADFAGVAIPIGNGSLVGVLSVFGVSKQISIRNLEDLEMNGPRCEGGGGTVSGDRIDISTIQSLFAMGTTNGPEGFIQGVVISDVDSENTPIRNLVIQDGSAGIIVRFSDNHIYPIGQELKVSTTNVEISEFNGGLQLNTTVDNVEVVGQGSLPTPRVATISEVLSNVNEWESTLIQINMAEVSGGSTFGDANEISDASGSVTTFVFNNATFVDEELPSGSVTVTGIVSDFNGAQIILRNREDVQGGTTGGGGGNGDQVSIGDLRTAFAGGAGTAPDGFIEGVVVSDYTTMSVNNQNLHIQDGERGIAIRFTEPHSFPLGAKLKVNINGTELSEFNGLLQLNNTEISQVESNTAGTLPTPLVLTISELNSNLEQYESTLIRIEGAMISGGTTFEGGLDVSDGTGTVELFTRSASTFAGSSVPTGTVSVTAIATEFNAPSLTIRSAADVN